MCIRPNKITNIIRLNFQMNSIKHFFFHSTDHIRNEYGLANAILFNNDELEEDTILDVFLCFLTLTSFFENVLSYSAMKAVWRDITTKNIEKKCFLLIFARTPS
jgi:hypothetical protein